jgi:hypothetical protein
MKHTDSNSLVYAIAERAKELGDSTMYELRLCLAEGDSMTRSSVYRELRGMTRGQLIEDVLLEEFVEEFTRSIE